jgi:uncharacterized protein (TIGR00369 family)
MAIVPRIGNRGNMTDWQQRGRSILDAQPFSVLIGAELVHLEPGKVELALDVTAQLLQQDGFVHGGVLSYLADNALTFAAGTALGVPAVTSEMKINYLRPAVGHRLIARAVAVHTGKTQSVARCDIFVVKDAEKLCAVAQGTIAALRESAK